MTDTLLPCLRCGRELSPEDANEYGYIECACSARYDALELDTHTKPGYYREWLAALACTCGNVDHYYDPTTVLVTRHRCRAGGVEMLPRPSN